MASPLCFPVRHGSYSPLPFPTRDTCSSSSNWKRRLQSGDHIAHPFSSIHLNAGVTHIRLGSVCCLGTWSRLPWLSKQPHRRCRLCEADERPPSPLVSARCAARISLRGPERQSDAPQPPPRSGSLLAPALRLSKGLSYFFYSQQPLPDTI